MELTEFPTGVYQPDRRDCGVPPLGEDHIKSIARISSRA